MQFPAHIHRRLSALVEEGIREGRIHPEDSAEALDARGAERALDEGRLLAACRSVSSLVRPGAWDEIRELAWEGGAPRDVFSWDRGEVITCAPDTESQADARW